MTEKRSKAGLLTELIKWLKGSDTPYQGDLPDDEHYEAKARQNQLERELEMETDPTKRAELEKELMEFEVVDIPSNILGEK